MNLRTQQTQPMGRQLQYRKRIQSDWGEDIQLEVTPHPAGEGFALMPSVVQVFVEAAAEILGALNLKELLKESTSQAMTGIKEEKSKEEVLESMTNMGVLQRLVNTDVKTDQLVGAIGSLAKNLALHGGVDLVKDILEHTTRCVIQNEQVVGGTKQNCAKHFDTIYQANYGELVRTIIFILMVNWGPAFKRLPFDQGG